VRMIPKPMIGWVCVLAAGLAAGPAAAQPSPGGLGTAIVLPQRLVAGQQATLAVLDAAGRLTPGAVVEFTGGERVTTDATGRAVFTAPADPGVLLVRLPGRGVSASTTVVAPQPGPAAVAQLVDHPRVICVFDRFLVEGFGFRGQADANRAVLGGQASLVLASSPVALVLLPAPGAAEGPTQLVIEVAGRSLKPVPVTVVSFEVSATKKQLAPGEKGHLTVRVRGTDQRLAIEARNLTTEVVQLPRGNLQRVTSSGGSANAAEIEMEGVRAGDFSISVRLVPGVYGLPDMEAVRQHLLAAQRLAKGDWQARLDRVIHRLERDPQDFARIRDELEKMLAEKPEGEFGREIEAAWRELLKR